MTRSKLYDLLPLSEQKWVRVDKQRIDFLPGDVREGSRQFRLQCSRLVQ